MNIIQFNLNPLKRKELYTLRINRSSQFLKTVIVDNIPTILFEEQEHTQKEDRFFMLYHTNDLPNDVLFRYIDSFSIKCRLFTLIELPKQKK